MPFPTAVSGERFTSQQKGMGWALMDNSLRGNNPGLRHDNDFMYTVGAVEGGWKSLTRPKKKKQTEYERMKSLEKKIFYQKLYVDGLMKKKRKIELMEKGEEDRAANELKGCTFKPNIKSK